MIPFGAACDFRPYTHILKGNPKFDDQSYPGVFLGYKTTSGGQFHGEYYVAKVKDFESEDSKVVPVYTVREVWTTPSVPHEFPLLADAIAKKRLIKKINYDKRGYLIGDEYDMPNGPEEPGGGQRETTDAPPEIMKVESPVDENPVDAYLREGEPNTAKEKDLFHPSDDDGDGAQGGDLVVDPSDLPDGTPPLYPDDADAQI